MEHDSVNYRSMEDRVNKNVDETATAPGSVGDGWMNWGARGMERNTLEGMDTPPFWACRGIVWRFDGRLESRRREGPGPIEVLEGIEAGRVASMGETHAGASRGRDASGREVVGTQMFGPGLAWNKHSMDQGC